VEAIAIAVALVVVTVGWIGTRLWIVRARKRWEKLAQAHGLRMRQGPDPAGLVLTGVMDGVIVSLSCSYNDRRIFNRTWALALFSLPMPRGLVIASHAVGKSIGGSPREGSFKLGVPRVDAVFQIHTDDAPATRTLLNNVRVADTLLQLSRDISAIAITEWAVVMPHNRWVTDRKTNEWMLKKVVNAVKEIEKALLWRVGTVDCTPAQPPVPDDGASPDPAPPDDVDEPASPPTAADRLIADLRADGAEDSVGFFTVDRHTAMQKLRQYQLSTPEWFVLELIQGAVASGAQSVSVTVQPGLSIRFDGSSFDKTDFEALWHSLLEPGDDDDIRARRALAIGLNGAVSSCAKYAAIRSRNGQTGVSLVLFADGEEQPEGQPIAQEGTEIFVKLRLRKWFSKLPNRIEDLIIDRCRFSAVPVKVTGRYLDSARPDKNADLVLDLEDVGAPGQCGFSDRYLDGARLFVVADGVLICELGLDEAPPGFFALVDGRALQRDLTRADVVRDRAYEDVMAAVHRAVQGAIESLCRRWDKEPEAWVGRALRAAAGVYPSLEDFRPEGQARILAEIAAWDTIGAPRRSLTELIEQVDGEEHLAYADFTLDRLCVEPEVAETSGIPLRTLHLHWMLRPIEQRFLALHFRRALRAHRDDLLALERDPDLVDAAVDKVLARLIQPGE